MSPAVLFILVCFTCTADRQIQVASILSCAFGFLMVMVVVGTIARTLNTSIVSPSSLIMYALIFVFLTSGLTHPSELSCLYAGLLYYLSLPSAFVLLNIYSIINMNNISWGTREIVKPTVLDRKDMNKARQQPTGKHILEQMQAFFGKGPKSQSHDHIELNGDLIDSLNR